MRDGERELGAAFEVDAEVEPPHAERDHRDEDEDPGQDRPPPGVRDELEVRALVVEVLERVALVLGHLGFGGRGRHAIASRASRPAPMPTPGMLTSRGFRARIDTSGCMKKYATSRSRMVDRPR